MFIIVKLSILEGIIQFNVEIVGRSFEEALRYARHFF